MTSISNLDMLENEIELLKSLEQITIAINLNHGEKSLHPYTKVNLVVLEQQYQTLFQRCSIT